MSESTEMVLSVPIEAIQHLDSVATAGRLAVEGANGFARAFAMAAAMRMLSDAITPEMLVDVMRLSGSRQGFRTDKDDTGGYPPEVVKRVLIEATLTGFRPVGNEMNIIGGNFYATKEGLARRIREWPGLADFRVTLGIPLDQGGKTCVPAIAVWLLNGRPDEIRCEGQTAIPIRRNAGMGDDAIHGKARRKLFALVLERLAGANADLIPTDGDVDDARIGVGVGATRPRPTFTLTAEADPSATGEAGLAASAARLAEIKTDLADSVNTDEVKRHMRAAYNDGTLSKADKAAVVAAANERMRELKR